MRRLAVLALLAAVAGACGGIGSGGGSASPPAPRALDVRLDEYEVTASQTAVPPGRAEAVVRNRGQLPHELAVVRTEALAEALPTVGGALDLSGADVVAEVGSLDPGTARELALDLPEGRYVLVCLVPGHYRAGMRTPLGAGRMG